MPPGASTSSQMSAKLCVSGGGSLHPSGGEMSSPSQVYWGGIDSPGSKAVLVNSKGAARPPSSVEAVGVGSGDPGVDRGDTGVDSGDVGVDVDGADVGVGADGADVGVGAPGVGVGDGPVPQPLVATATRITTRNSTVSFFILASWL
jgi:hypothetical protein